MIESLCSVLRGLHSQTGGLDLVREDLRSQQIEGKGKTSNVPFGPLPKHLSCCLFSFSLIFLPLLPSLRACRETVRQGVCKDHPRHWALPFSLCGRRASECVFRLLRVGQREWGETTGKGGWTRTDNALSGRRAEIQGDSDWGHCSPHLSVLALGQSFDQEAQIARPLLPSLVWRCGLIWVVLFSRSRSTPLSFIRPPL